MDNMSFDVGKSLKRIRSEMKLSLDGVSKLTGVSKAMLGQIERGESVPTIMTLWKISTGLKATISNFISSPSDSHSFVRLEDITPVQEENGDMLLYNIFPFNPISGFDYFQIVMNPKCIHQSIPHANVATEYIVVDQGCLKVVIDGEVFVLGKGNAISFNGNSVHSYENPIDEKTVFQNIIRYI